MAASGSAVGGVWGMGGHVGGAGFGPGVLGQDLAVEGGEDDPLSVPGDGGALAGVGVGDEERDALEPYQAVGGGLEVMASPPRARTCSTSRPCCPRRVGFRAAPLSISSRWGTPLAATPLSKTPGRGLAGLGLGDQGGDRQTRVVVLQLEDDDRAPADEHAPRWRRAASRRWGRGRRSGARPSAAVREARPAQRPQRGRYGPATPARAPPGPSRPSCHGR